MENQNASSERETPENREPSHVGLSALLGGVLLPFCFIGCANDPVATNATTNAAIKVELLFENDGVKVYRFKDCGRYIYFTDARGAASWSVNKGKNGTDHFEVETVK